MTDQNDKAASVMDLVERERRFLAEELHEGLCQNLCGLSIHLKVLERRLKLEAPQLKDDFAALLHTLDETIDQTRFLYRTLKPAVSTGAALAAAIEELAKSKQVPFACEDSFRFHSEELSSFQATGLFRMAQEALRKAASSPVKELAEIALRGRDAKIQLAFNFHEPGKSLEAYGQEGMADYAKQIGAVMSGDGPTHDNAAFTTINYSLQTPE